jgi:hypothetical protein
MTREEINARLEEMYRGEKSKKFLDHLIRAYFPVNKVEKVWDKPKGRFKCAITNLSLVSVQEAFEVQSSKEYFNDMMNHIKSGFSGNTEEIEHPNIKAFGDRKMGLTSKDTDTFLAFPVYQVFYDWLVNKLFKGDKHIYWILKQIQADMFFDKVRKVSDNKKQTENDIKKVKKVFQKRKVTTFGDLEALQRIKAELEKEEKRK